MQESLKICGVMNLDILMISKYIHLNFAFHKSEGSHLEPLDRGVQFKSSNNVCILGYNNVSCSVRKSIVAGNGAFL